MVVPQGYIASPVAMAYDRLPVGGSGVMNERNALGIAVALFATLATHCEGQTVGSRPYEMVWANRQHDTRPPLLDFESLEGWTVSTQQAVAAWELSQEQLLWGEHVAKLVYRGSGPQPQVTLDPPAPVPLHGTVRLHQSVGLRKQLGLGAGPDYAPGGDPRRAAERRRHFRRA